MGITEPAIPDAYPRPRKWTRAEYDRLADLGILGPDDRVELIAGEVLEQMSPQKSQHAAGIRAVEIALSRVYAVGYDVRVQMPLAVSGDSEPDPDVAVIRGSFRDYVDAHPTTAALVVEVSDTTLAFDRGAKAALYAGAGVPEYWVLNLAERALEVHRDPEPAPTGASLYRSITRLSAEDILTPNGATGSIAVRDLLP